MAGPLGNQAVDRLDAVRAVDAEARAVARRLAASRVAVSA
jgi:hypothetical protein